jgi:hypothetical protein
MIPIQNKEHLVYFMQCGMLRLSRYDLRFIQSLQTLSNQNKNLTTNQIDLFNKLVGKYQRQLAKHGLTMEKINALKWETNIITSDRQFTEAYISIVDNNIIFKSPFSKKFLAKFSKLEVNSYKWNKEEKVYRSPFSVYALRYLNDLAKEFYPKINYCPATTDLINKLESYRAKYWNPTLVKINDRYLIACTNQYLDLAIKDIELSADPMCLSKLTELGIEIDKDIINDDPLLEFCSKYYIDADTKNLDSIIEYLLAIGCKNVLIYPAPLNINIKEKFSVFNIYNNKTFGVLDGVGTQEDTVYIAMRSSNLAKEGNYMKVIRMNNTLPVVFNLKP